MISDDLSKPNTNQQKLLSSFKNRKYDEFNNLIKCPDIDVDHFYADPDNGTLLDLACRSHGNQAYIYTLILNGASIWLQNQLTGKLALNEALANSDPSTIQQFIMALRQRIFIAGDKFANTLMHTAIEKNNVEITRFIVRCLPRTTKYPYNPKAPHFILLQGSIEAARVFIEHFDVDMEFQKDTQGRVRSCREIILQKYPQLGAELPTRSTRQLQDILFSYLRFGLTELFVNRVAEIDKKTLDEGLTDGDKTYLHLACEYNYIDVVNALLKKNIRLNKRAGSLNDFSTSLTPIMVAAYKGHSQIVQRLLSLPVVELQIEGTGSVLHSTIRGMNDRAVTSDSHRLILKSLLDRRFPEPHRLNIDLTDKMNMTALHYAIAFNNEIAISSLVHAGANLYLRNPEGKLPLTSIPPIILERYFDNCIHAKKYWISSTKSEETIRFDYKVFRQLDQSSNPTGHEMKFFAIIKREPELRKLFKHPLTKSFLYIKWCFVKKYYCFALTFYLLFCLVLSAYIFQIQDCSSSRTISNSSTSYQCKLSWVSASVTLFFYLILVLNELCTFFLSILSYSWIKNWLKIIIISVVDVFLISEYNAHLAATAILTSWIEFVFLLGKLPSLSIYIEMFKTVTLNFAKFFILYSILIASFAYSFFILFNDKANETRSNTDKNNSINSWQNPPVSLIKSIIMMTGEFDASNLPLGSNLNYGYLFFIFFVFLVTIVLHNLLHGLAVSDTRAIMENVEVVALITGAKQISQFERMAHGNPFKYVRSRWPSFFNHESIRKLERGFLFFRDNIYRYQIIMSFRMGTKMTVFVRPSEQNKMTAQFFSKEHIGIMPSCIVKQAEQIIEKRNQSESTKNTDQHIVVKTDPSNIKSVEELVTQFGELCELTRKLDTKISEIDAKIAEIDVKIVKRDEKFLQELTHKLDTKNAEIDAKIAEIDAKIVKRDEKLSRDVEQIRKLLESVVQTSILNGLDESRIE
ncbi:transient receptor potential cation channel protein painless-like [Planococcus citri]|uniref:transient receptor potential cation channel protein painless-like n=1 Tax=Planococcus citri TaxID=170843 RepID=UPI0031F7B45B